MKASVFNNIVLPEVLQLKGEGKTSTRGDVWTETFEELESVVFAALQTYSNVYRGSGHNSINL